MARDFNNKNIDGITDLVVVAPIRDGFIPAYENVTFATRLKLVAEALNRIRVSAREHERVTPYSDVTERILTLLDFRIGVIDKDLLAFAGGDGQQLKGRRYLYLTATFDGAWEPYMRLIWNPLGPFLDLLFCNCDGYVTAVDHGFEEYAQWVRDNQINSAIFYAASGLTVRDGRYLSQLERFQRRGDSALALARATMPMPEIEAAHTRAQHRIKSAELALEALNVLYKLADYYPPQWLTGQDGGLAGLNEGHRLVHVADELLLGWDELAGAFDQLLQGTPPPDRQAEAAFWALARRTYAEPLAWFASGKADLARRAATRLSGRRPDPVFERSQVQAGILPPPARAEAPVRHGALLLFSIRDAARARAALARLPVAFDGDDGIPPAICCTLGLTADGLLRLGTDPALVDLFPREFREGMAARSGLIGDQREQHPRNWILPVRNGPAIAGLVPAGVRLPPVETSEIDLVVQLRSRDADRASLEAMVQELARADGLALQAVEWLEAGYDADGRFRDHFGLVDGISQPRPQLPTDAGCSGGGSSGGRDAVALGEVLLGYGNDRSDAAPAPFASFAPERAQRQQAVQALQRNGSFLVLRKIGTDRDAFHAWIGAEVARINSAHSLATPMTAERLQALILGRHPDGAPLIPAGPGGNNDFDFSADPAGELCPHAAHVRRANPRVAEFGRPVPRLVRRGLRFDQIDADGQRQRGLMFMAYNASIAEQYEVIQRWLNGGNSSGVASAHNDPLTGVLPKTEAGHFRFIATDRDGNRIPISIRLPAVEPAGTPEPGRHPFAPLHWGLYLFVPSRAAITTLAEQTAPHRILRQPDPRGVGEPILQRLEKLAGSPPERARELKRLLEDFDAKDPAEADQTPHVWAAIRSQHGGACRFAADGPPYDWQAGPDPASQGVVLCAGPAQVRAVLANWADFTTEEQLRRIAPTSGPIFVTQQPDNVYHNSALAAAELDYPTESTDTNAILYGFTADYGFAHGYAAGAAVLAMAKRAAASLGRTSFKLELRRQYLLPALGGLCQAWYGLPDGLNMQLAGWSWQPANTRTAHCPGDFLSPSRHAFYPRPGPEVAGFADDHGKAILKATQAFVDQHRAAGTQPSGAVAQAMFAAIPDRQVLARNLVGTLVGAIPPMDGNLRSILFEWLDDKSLWRHQAALHAALAGRDTASNFATVRGVLEAPIAQAMCKRPAPDLLYRTALRDTQIDLDPDQAGQARTLPVKKGDLVIVSQVSAAQQSLLAPATGGTIGADVAFVFGGRRAHPAQGYAMQAGRAVPDPAADPRFPVHACPAQPMAMGGIMGIMAALLDAGSIQALPASLIVRISDWA